MATPQQEKATEQIFAGSLAMLAVLIAVVGLTAAVQDRIAGIDYLAVPFSLLQWFLAILSALSGLLAVLSLQRMTGGSVPFWLIAWLARSLIVGTVLATIAFVWYS